MSELTERQLEQLDFIDSISYHAMCTLLGDELEWDMEWIGEISDVLAGIAEDYFGVSEMDTYPYIEEE